MSATDLERAVTRPIPLVLIKSIGYQLPAQIVIHFTFLLSAMAVASTDRLMVGAGKPAREH